MSTTTTARALRELEQVFRITGATLEISGNGAEVLAMLMPRASGSPAIAARGATAGAALVALHVEIERLADELIAELGRGGGA